MKDFLKNSFIFRNMENEEFIEAIENINPEIRRFEREDAIFSSNEFTKEIGIIKSGRCMVKKAKSQGDDIPLNVLFQNDSFGVISVLTDREEYPTEIIALEKTEIVFISQRDINFLLDNYVQISKNLIAFLADRIVFLNDKISTFSGYNVEQKLSNYLLQLLRKTNDNTLIFSRSAVARAINLSRASLYRGIDALILKGIISLEGKKIIINDPDGLERNSK
jgi:CRP-like cAMP-binding protein